MVYDVGSSHQEMSFGQVDKYRCANVIWIAILGHTVNRPDRVAKFCQGGLRNFIEDFPRYFIERLDRHAPTRAQAS